MANWGMMIGAGKGISDFAGIMGEHRKNRWEDMREEIKFQRQKNLEELKMRFQGEEREKDRQAQYAITKENQQAANARNTQDNEAAMERIRETSRVRSEAALEEWNRTKSYTQEQSQKAADLLEQEFADNMTPEVELMIKGYRNNVDVSSVLKMLSKGDLRDVTAEEMKIHWEASQMIGAEKEWTPEQVYEDFKKKIVSASRNFKSPEEKGGRVELTDPAEIKQLADLVSKQDPEGLNFLENKAGPITATKVKQLVLEETEPSNSNNKPVGSRLESIKQGIKSGALKDPVSLDKIYGEKPGGMGQFENEWDALRSKIKNTMPWKQ